MTFLSKTEFVEQNFHRILKNDYNFEQFLLQKLTWMRQKISQKDQKRRKSKSFIRRKTIESMVARE